MGIFNREYYFRYCKKAKYTYSRGIMVIRMRHTRAHTGNRHSHHALKGNTIVTDTETKTKHLRHRASLETGTYRGRQVLDVTKKAIKNAKKAN